MLPPIIYLRRGVRIARNRVHRIQWGATGPYDRTRPLGTKGFYSACYAPFGSMYFDQLGGVRACCQNTGHLLGDVRTQSIREIWESASAGQLRGAVARRDFGRGCDFCAWQVGEHNEDIVYARTFDHLQVEAPDERWPRQMEFALSNACNLQCAMCNGEWSSAIRIHREGLAPLPTVYTDAFFDELAEFLPHLDWAKFLGGEPFLGREPLRVMDLMVDLGLHTPTVVTTNGTQWSGRIERIVDALPVNFVLSLDGCTPETFERIRVGASFDQVIRNLDRFTVIAHLKGTVVSLAHCLMPDNWQEFPDFLRFAEKRRLTVGVNIVQWPADHSLYQLPAAGLAEVVRGLEARDAEMHRDLDLNLETWDEQLDSLRHRLRAAEAEERGVAVGIGPDGGGAR